ncbi:hypothetical protein KIN20_020831 [Parelaphostrongylus tenuis]|uniref:Phosphotransferase n=1 Tax=Parelaphostrongylus tenuis TaxID=148309 RepID=A0AAD5QU10_PARTN|nr:hypothetical protein KIN20_020831 [Parelaphostrongylus tenuis]
MVSGVIVADGVIVSDDVTVSDDVIFWFARLNRLLNFTKKLTSMVFDLLKNVVESSEGITYIKPPNDEEDFDRIRERCHLLELSDDQLREMMVCLEKSMNEGLAKETAATAAVKMLPSYVLAVPNGTERGDFLSLDLGGTNFRVLLIRLNGKDAEVTSKIFRIPESIMRGTGEALFDHIADCMAKFMTEEGVNDAVKLPLGFTFSFPCEQHGLTSAKLLNWTKGFSASDVEGDDVVRLLREACRRRKDVDVDVVAVLNDTVGTLMACAFKKSNCRVGVIVGTGTNACYMEKLDRIEKLNDEIKADISSDEMIINTEWGAFGDDGSIDWLITPFDRQVDSLSINPGKQL